MRGARASVSVLVERGHLEAVTTVERASRFESSGPDRSLVLWADWAQPIVVRPREHLAVALEDDAIPVAMTPGGARRPRQFCLGWCTLRSDQRSGAALTFRLNTARAPNIASTAPVLSHLRNAAVGAVRIVFCF